MRLTIQERLKKHTQVDETTGCWNWTRRKGFWGYGAIKVSGKCQLAHRVSYQVFKGEFPQELCILHTCDNPACINPDHLFTGTNYDNVLDKVSKGRQSRASTGKGSASAASKITEDNVLFIRSSDLKQQELADMFGITQSQVSNIQHRKAWTHI